MTDFDLLLTTTTFLRGMGAGVIFGMAVITLPVRKRLGTKIYATFIKAHYQESGVKIYAGITVLGLLFTGWLAIITYTDNYPDYTRYCIIGSLLATLLGFAGTAGAFPTMRKLWKLSGQDASETERLLDKFVLWHVISTIAHITAFIFLLLVMY